MNASVGGAALLAVNGNTGNASVGWTDGAAGYMRVSWRTWGNGAYMAYNTGTGQHVFLNRRPTSSIGGWVFDSRDFTGNVEYTGNVVTIDAAGNVSAKGCLRFSGNASTAPLANGELTFVGNAVANTVAVFMRCSDGVLRSATLTLT